MAIEFLSFYPKQPDSHTPSRLHGAAILMKPLMLRLNFIPATGTIWYQMTGWLVVESVELRKLTHAADTVVQPRDNTISPSRIPRRTSSG